MTMIEVPCRACEGLGYWRYEAGDDYDYEDCGVCKGTGKQQTTALLESQKQKAEAIVSQMRRLYNLFPRADYLFVSQEMLEDYELYTNYCLYRMLIVSTEPTPPDEHYPTMRIQFTGVYFKGIKLAIVHTVL